MKAKVLDVSIPRRVQTRFGIVAVLTKALIGDETGKIMLCLWNGQSENASVGKTIVIDNARASRFRGMTQLSLMPNIGGVYQEGSLPAVSLFPPELQTE